MIGRRRPAVTPPGGGTRQHLLGTLRDIPAGRVVTFEKLAAHLAVSQAEVTTILSRLTEDERQVTPWHRIVAKGGAIGRGPWRERQFALLVREGIPVSPAGIVQEMASRAISNLSAVNSAKPATAPPAGTPPNRSRGMKDRP